MRTRVSDARRVVIKLGSNLFFNDSGAIALGRIFSFIEDIAAARVSGRQIIVEATMECPAAAQQSPPRAAHRFDGQTTVHLLRGDAARLHTPHRGLDLISGRLITQAQIVR